MLVPTFTERGNAIVPLGIAALGLVLYVVFHPGVRTAVPARPMRRWSCGMASSISTPAGASRRSSSRPVPDPAGRSASDPDPARPLASRVAA